MGKVPRYTLRGSTYTVQIVIDPPGWKDSKLHTHSPRCLSILLRQQYERGTSKSWQRSRWLQSAQGSSSNLRLFNKHSWLGISGRWTERLRLIKPNSTTAGHCLQVILIKKLTMWLTEMTAPRVRQLLLLSSRLETAVARYIQPKT